MSKAERLRKARGGRSFNKWFELTGVHPGTQRAWEKGVREPNAGSVDKIADSLNWDDDIRMSFMPEPKSKDGLSRRFERRLQYLRLNDKEASLILDVEYSTVGGWRRRFIPKGSRYIIEDFLEMSEEEAYKTLMVREGFLPKTEIKKKPRKKIPYELIYKLENEFGGLRLTPDDHPVLKELQEAVR